MRTEITKRHLNNHIRQYYGMKTRTVTPSFYNVFNISLYCNDSIPSFIRNLWRVLLLGNHLSFGSSQPQRSCNLKKVLIKRSVNYLQYCSISPISVIRFCYLFLRPSYSDTTPDSRLTHESCFCSPVVLAASVSTSPKSCIKWIVTTWR